MTPEELKEALELAEHIGQNENSYRPEAVTVSRTLLYYCQWRDIESAPKDGLFLAWLHERRRVFSVFRDGPENNIVVDGVRGKRWIATRWLPLPPAPEGE